MTGFSADWLALREPADHASVNALVRDTLRQHFAERTSVTVVDLGSGAGSNLRGLSPVLGFNQSWTLVDYDPKLLAVAKARAESAPPAGVTGLTFREADLSGGGFDPIITNADLVTAAALFDLVSVGVIERLADAVAAHRQVFATVLSYDGIAAFLPPHPADGDMRNLFNDHQKGNKGFGPAAGPGATDALAKAFSRHGYRITRGRSPWVLAEDSAQLRRDVDRGWANAVRETGRVPNETIDEWIAHRERSQNAVTIVGHEDIIALPPL